MWMAAYVVIGPTFLQLKSVHICPTVAVTRERGTQLTMCVYCSADVAYLAAESRGWSVDTATQMITPCLPGTGCFISLPLP